MTAEPAARPTTVERAARPWRVVFVLPTTGEFDSRTRRLASALVSRGHDARVLARADAESAEAASLAPGIPIVRVPADPADGLPAILPAWLRAHAGAALRSAERVSRELAGGARPGSRRRLGRLALEPARVASVALAARGQARAAAAAADGLRPVDAYHAMGFLALPVALAMARTDGARVVYDVRDLYAESNNVARLPRPVRRLFARRERRWARRADAIVTVNDALADVLVRRWAVGRPTVIRNCSPAWTPPDPPPDLLRATLGLDPGTPIVLYHGGFMPDRGLPELLAALREPGLEAAHLVLLGSGALEPELRRLAAEPASGGRVHLLPPVPPDELLPWVASADVGVMVNQPRTLNERLSTPNKLYESLAAGLPVVSSDFPERRRIVIDDPDGPLGAVCDPTDPAAIARAIRSILELDPAARADLRARVLRAAHARYSWETQLDVALGLYERVMGASGGTRGRADG